MDVEEARRVLGVAAGASPTEIRAAFRRCIRLVHPDVVGGPQRSVGAAVTEVIAAYRLLRSQPEPVRAAAQPRQPTVVPVRVSVRGDTVHVALGPAQLWPIALDLAHGLGEVAYVDRSVPVVETIVEFVGHPVCSVLLAVEPRAGGASALVCAVEALGGDRPPESSAVARLVAARLAAYET